MTNLYSEMFERMHIQQLLSFIQYGAECGKIETKSYKERIDETIKPAIDLIRQRFPAMDDYEKVTAAFYRYGGACGDVHMEIGFRYGFILAMQILSGIDWQTGA